MRCAWGAESPQVNLGVMPQPSSEVRTLVAGIDYHVGIVADPQFGERLVALASRLHVWAVGSPMNRAVAKRVWPREPGHSVTRGVTVFHLDATKAPDQHVSGILGSVLDHHGEYAHDPPVNGLEIYGCPLTPSLQKALAAVGFTSIVQFGDAVLAIRAPAA